MTFETIKIIFITLMEFVVFTAHRFVGIDFIQVAWCRGEDLDEFRSYDADGRHVLELSLHDVEMLVESPGLLDLRFILFV